MGLPNKVANGTGRGRRQDPDGPENEKLRSYVDQKKKEKRVEIEFVGTRI